jgi:Fic family protein
MTGSASPYSAAASALGFFYQPRLGLLRLLSQPESTTVLIEKVLNRLLDGFEGKLTNSKWAALAKTSPDIALRDITDLLKRDILIKDEGGGRSTSYSLKDVSDGV